MFIFFRFFVLKKYSTWNKKQPTYRARTLESWNWNCSTVTGSLVAQKSYVDNFMFQLIAFDFLLFAKIYHKRSTNPNSRSRPKACNFIKKETLTQVFSCEFCEISRSTFFIKHLRTTASESQAKAKQHPQAEL